MKKIAYTLLCLMLIGAIASAWHFDRKRYTYKLKQDFLQYAYLGSELHSTRYNLLFAEMLSMVEKGELSKAEFDRRIEVQLYAGLSQIYLHRNKGKEIVVEFETDEGLRYRREFNNSRTTKRDAGRILWLLQIESSKELNDMS